MCNRINGNGDGGGKELKAFPFIVHYSYLDFLGVHNICVKCLPQHAAIPHLLT